MNACGQWAAESGAATGYEPVNDADALRAMGMHHLICRTSRPRLYFYVVQCSVILTGLSAGEEVSRVSSYIISP